jgi:predicted AAA+ superfamily ATPase
MYKRLLSIPPTESFFLFGPRGTGKSTWLKTIFKPDLYIDLLRSENYFELSNNPELLRAKALALIESKKQIKVVIDEIQRIPNLLNEVHALIEDHKGKFQFVLTGSSARKLKRKDSNLLAGRALSRYFFTLSEQELKKDFSLENSLKYGNLPKVQSLTTNEAKIDFLMAYTETYLKEEIQQEALVRNLTSYQKFLKHLSIMNGQVLNLSNISREAGIQRAPLENYMSILQDTLLGVLIEPLHLKAKVKEVSTPKFYFFDTGVARALSGQIEEDLDLNSGFLFETLILNELRIYKSLNKNNLEINYWATPQGSEVDFILSKGKKKIGIEVKYSKKWRPEFSNGLETLLTTKKIDAAYVVYIGNSKELHGKILLLPFSSFCEQLYNGKLI